MSCENYDYPATLNPFENGTIGKDTEFFDQINNEYHKVSSPEMYARIVQRNINLEKVELNGTTEYEYLKDNDKLDELYEEQTEKTLLAGAYRVYGVSEWPAWAQELGKFGTTEGEELTLTFNVSSLQTNLDGSVLHIGDLIKKYDNIYGWKYYEVRNALGFGNMLGQYLMWQVIAIKTDLEGYTDLDTKEEIVHHDALHTPSNPPDENPNTVTEDPNAPAPPLKPRPRVY